MIGTMYEDDVIATSFGNYVCLPLLRKAGTNLTKEEAKKVLEDCLRVLFYRNTKSSTRVRPPPPHTPPPPPNAGTLNDSQTLAISCVATES